MSPICIVQLDLSDRLSAAGIIDLDFILTDFWLYYVFLAIPQMYAAYQLLSILFGP